VFSGDLRKVGEFNFVSCHSTMTTLRGAEIEPVGFIKTWLFV
jgi:hypothetical protein